MPTRIRRDSNWKGYQATLKQMGNILRVSSQLERAREEGRAGSPRKSRDRDALSYSR